MEDDGNCQFRALSHELYGHQRWHGAVRARVMAHLHAHADRFSMYIGGCANERTNERTNERERTKQLGVSGDIRCGAGVAAVGCGWGLKGGAVVERWCGVGEHKAFVL
jgi:hypothetical protein